MVLQRPQHTRQAEGDARIRIVIGDAQIAAEHEKYEAARQDAERPQGGRDIARGLRGIQSIAIWGAERLHPQTNGNGDKSQSTPAR